MPRPPKPSDNRTFREKLIPNIKHARATAIPLDKAESSDGISRRIADLETKLEGVANRKQRQRIKESIAAARRAQQDVTQDLEVIADREARANDPKYIEAVRIATATLEAVKINETLHIGFVEDAEKSLKELRHSLDYASWEVRQQSLKAAYDEDRRQKRAALETHRQAIGEDIQLLSSGPAPGDPAIIESRPGTKRHLFDTEN